MPPAVMDMPIALEITTCDTPCLCDVVYVLQRSQYGELTKAYHQKYLCVFAKWLYTSVRHNLGTLIFYIADSTLQIGV